MNTNESELASKFILPKLKTVSELEKVEDWMRKTIKSLTWWEEELKLYLMWIEWNIGDKIISIIYWID